MIYQNSCSPSHENRKYRQTGKVIMLVQKRLIDLYFAFSFKLFYYYFFPLKKKNPIRSIINTIKKSLLLNFKSTEKKIKEKINYDDLSSRKLLTILGTQLCSAYSFYIY